MSKKSLEMRKTKIKKKKMIKNKRWREKDKLKWRSKAQKNLQRSFFTDSTGTKKNKTKGRNKKHLSIMKMKSIKRMAKRKQPKLKKPLKPLKTMMNIMTKRKNTISSWTISSCSCNLSSFPSSSATIFSQQTSLPSYL